MDYGKPSEIQTLMLNEARTKSGIMIEANFNLMCSIVGYDNAVNANGCYTTCFNQEVIIINNLWNTPYTNLTVFHELAHATGQPHRFNRIMTDESNPAVLWIEELTAELTGIALLTHFGLEDDAAIHKAMNYIRSFQAVISEYEVRMAKEQSEAAFNYILKNWLPDFNERRQNDRQNNAA